jgi:hypothetical protein
MLSPAFTPWDFATSGLMTALTGLPPVRVGERESALRPLLRGSVSPGVSLLEGVHAAAGDKAVDLAGIECDPLRGRIGTGQRDALFAARGPQQRHSHEREQRQRDQDGGRDEVGLPACGERPGCRVGVPLPGV